MKEWHRPKHPLDNYINLQQLVSLAYHQKKVQCTMYKIVAQQNVFNGCIFTEKADSVSLPRNSIPLLVDILSLLWSQRGFINLVLVINYYPLCVNVHCPYLQRLTFDSSLGNGLLTELNSFWKCFQIWLTSVSCGMKSMNEQINNRQTMEKSCSILLISFIVSFGVYYY